MRAASKEKETDIVRALCDYLALRKRFFWRQNTAPLYREGRFFAMPKYALKGVPDIIVIDDTGMTLEEKLKEVLKRLEKHGIL
mgnify:CR=1 FL=1